MKAIVVKYIIKTDVIATLQRSRRLRDLRPERNIYSVFEDLTVFNPGDITT